ncbi:MAG: tetratricopeptide repeat protein [Xanthobacteraceae bacterium]
MRIFVSAVTNEFGKARDSVASDLRARGHEVKVQSDFTQGGDAEFLLERLHDYIRDCNAVACVIGKRSGSCPPPDKAQRFAKMLPVGIAEASYTEWEFFFARHYRRRLYTYIANDDYAPDEPTPTGADFPALQTAFVQHVKAESVHWAPFSNVDRLGRAVLREDWTAPSPPPPPQRPKPIVLPYPSLGPLFKGRESFLRQLHESLTGDGKTAITGTRQALYGLGGIGKTRAAVEYAWAHENDYSALLFVVAETPEALRANLVSLTKTLVPQVDTADDNVRLQAVLGWLATDRGWLLVLDNVDSREAMAAVEALLKDLRGGRLVVTSRLSDFSGNFAPLPLDVLPVDDAAAFLLERTEGRRRKSAEDEAKAREIAKELDGLALALEQAAAYIAKKRLTFEGYLHEWRSTGRGEILGWFDRQSVTAYPRAVAVTWQTSVAQLTEPSRRMLERLAWLAPEKVPDFLLDVAIPGVKDENLHEALDDLAAYSLVTRDAAGPFFLVHRLVQDVTRRNLHGERQQQTLEESLEWINVAFPRDTHDVRSWPLTEALLAHARAIVAHADSAAIVEPTAGLMNALGLLLKSKALYAEAEPFSRRSLAIGEKAFEADHPDVRAALNNLAGLYRAQGRYTEAEPLLRRALEISERALGPDHLDVGALVNNLAELSRDLDRDNEAEPLFQRALAIRERAFGSDHPDVGIILNNLASLYQSQDRHAEAESLYQRSLAMTERALGPEHPAVARTLNNLAALYRSQEKYAQAEPLYRRSLAIREKALGPDHDEVANSLNSLGLFYASQGRNGEAIVCFRRCVSILLTISHQIGRNHPYLELAMNNYADLLGKSGRGKSEIEVEVGKLLRGEA